MQKKNGFDLSIEGNIHSMRLDHDVYSEIKEFRTPGKIASIEKYMENVPDWIKRIILPDFFDLKWLSEIIHIHDIKSKEELCRLFKSKKCSEMVGSELAYLYYHFVMHSDWKEFPVQYACKYTNDDLLESKYMGVPLKGNFHNHSTFSDGIYSIHELKDLAIKNDREYIGISDHTQRLLGVTDDTLVEQHRIIEGLNLKSQCKILKSVECEILSDGALDLSEKSLKSLDYTIIAIHRDTCQAKSTAEKRLIKAIENPYANILAHPSARLYKKKIELCVDMYMIIDACVANNVAIEINGDPDRLDLDPKYISYALNKGAMFTIDSDTHLPNSFKHINNALHIANDYHIPPDLCLNTKSVTELSAFFRKH